MQALAQLLNYIFDAYIFILLLRFLLQKLQASWHNPVTKFVITLTNPIVKITRRVIPGYRGYDFSILVVALLVEIAELYVVNWIRLGFTLDFSGVILLAVVALVTKVVYIILFSIMIWAFLSWFTAAAQRNPVSEVTGIIAYPWLRLARRFVPLVGGIDLSPVVVLIVLYLVMAFVLTPITGVGLNLAIGT
jgi:YggT family protein